VFGQKCLIKDFAKENVLCSLKEKEADMKTPRVLHVTAFIVLASLMVFFFTTPNALAKPSKPISVGCVVPLGFLFGKAAARSAELAVEEINAAGGVKVGGEMRPFKLEVADGRSTEPGTPTSETLLVLEKLILEKGVGFFVGGPIRSEAALASMDLFARYRSVVIWGAGTLTPALSKRIADNPEKYKHLFRESGEVVWLIKELNSLFDELKAQHGFNKVHIVVQDVEHARKAGGAIAATLGKRGWTITGQDRFPAVTSDFSAPLLNAKSKGAEALFVWGEAPSAQILIKQWATLKIPVLPLGFINIIEPTEAWKETDGKCEYVIATQVNAGAAYADFNPWVVRWWKAYKKKYGAAPEMYCVQVPYTSVYVLKDAIERAGSLDPDKVAKAIEETDLKGTPQGRIRFNPKTHDVIPSLDPEQGAVGTVFQWQAGKRVVIFPPKIAKGKILLPPWMK
jgi:branched-chain amino acid transport system substrate-binding protein